MREDHMSIGQFKQLLGRLDPGVEQRLGGPKIAKRLRSLVSEWDDDSGLSVSLVEESNGRRKLMIHFDAA
jgi:hypothetical protein